MGTVRLAKEGAITRTTHAPRSPCAAHKRSAPAWRWRALDKAIGAGLVVALVLLLAPLGALANSYERGNWLCENFADAEQDYRSEPNDIYWQRGYARCLIARGQGDDTMRGLSILHNIVDHNTHLARTGAAWMIADYLSSGGTFEDRIGENTINEAIDAYKRVVLFIDLDSNYPEDGNSTYEEEV